MKSAAKLQLQMRGTAKMEKKKERKQRGRTESFDAIITNLNRKISHFMSKHEGE